LSIQLSKADLNNIAFNCIEDVRDQLVSASMGFMDIEKASSNVSSYVIENTPTGVEMTIKVPDDGSAEELEKIFQDNLESISGNISDKFASAVDKAIKVDDIESESIL